jgi:hypothetical protein
MVEDVLLGDPLIYWPDRALTINFKWAKATPNPMPAASNANI